MDGIAMKPRIFYSRGWWRVTPPTGLNIPNATKSSLIPLYQKANDFVIGMNNGFRTREQRTEVKVEPSFSSR